MAQVPTINLLPPEIKQKRESERNIVIFAIVVIVWVLVLTSALALVKISSSSERATLEALKSESVALDTQIAQYRIYEEKKQQLKQLESIYQKVSGNRMSWYKVLIQIALVALDNVRLTGLISDNNTFQIDGEAKNIIDIATWMVRIEELPAFDQVWLDNLATGGGKIKFTVKGNVVTRGQVQ